MTTEVQKIHKDEITLNDVQDKIITLHERATATTIAIVEAFAKIRELSNMVTELVKSPDDSQKQAVVMQKSNEILSDMVTKELQTTGTETSFEINPFSAGKIKHTIKKEIKK